MTHVLLAFLAGAGVGACLTGLIAALLLGRDLRAPRRAASEAPEAQNRPRRAAERPLERLLALRAHIGSPLER